jgi:heavy metal translocating P-type ATPase
MSVVPDSNKSVTNIVPISTNDAVSLSVIKDSAPKQAGEQAHTGRNTTLDYQVKHSIPGRLRLKVNNLLFDAKHASGCILEISLLKGVDEVSTNYWNANAIISYDPEVIDVDTILDRLDALTYNTSHAVSTKGDRPPKHAESFIVRAFRKVLTVLDRSLPAHLQLAFGVAAFASGVLQLPAVATKILLGFSMAPITSRALHTVLDEKKVGVDALDGIAAGLMLANGRLLETGFMTMLIAGGEFIRERTAKRCEEIVGDLLGLSGRFAWLVKGKKRICVPADEVQVGDTVVVYPGDMVPVDGIVTSGEAEIDQSKLTGESLPVEVKVGSTVLASTVAVEGKIHVRATAVGSQTKAGLVLECIASAPIHETKIQNYAALIADKMVVPIFIGAASCFVLTRNLSRLMSMLIFDFSTGVRIAAPTAVLASMHRAGKRGILIKTGSALEKLATVDAIVFDKTGTLTSGEPKVVHVERFNGHTADEVLALAASVEARLHHPASRAIVKAAQQKGLVIQDRATSEFVRGMGVKATIGDLQVVVGSRRLMDEEAIDVSEAAAAEQHAGSVGESIAYVAINNRVAGLIRYSDTLRAEAVDAMAQLKRLGIKRLIMATGDGKAAAERIAAKVGLKEVQAQAFPEQKAALVLQLKEAGYVVAVIGDGINDSPALAHADVAISLHGGTEAAKCSANVVLTDDDLRRLPEAIKIARSAMDLVRQNLGLAVVPNSAGLGLAAFGMVGPAGATLLNNGSAIVAALNSLRPLYVNNWSVDEAKSNQAVSKVKILPIEDVVN